MIHLSEKDKKDTIERYTERYRKYGYSPKSLGWDKGKQDARFDILTSQYDLTDSSILDIGCGFGDLNKALTIQYGDRYKYLGIDLVDKLTVEANNRYSREDVSFLTGDFLNMTLPGLYDYAFASGIFNHKLQNQNNYQIIEATIDKALQVCHKAIAFDFLSDKVDYELQHAFYSSPEKILSIAYKFSRNVVLRNDYMPFEFSIFIIKDDSYNNEDTIFNCYNNSK